MSQENRLLTYLKINKTITANQALSELGIARLAARVYRLKEKGFIIHTNIIEVENKYGETCRIAEYVLLRGKE